jgi:dihydropteroate synthase
LNIKKISNDLDFKELLEKVGVDIGGVSILKSKMNMNLFYIKKLKTPAANILKQDCLSIGADLAVPKNTILCQDEFVDAILIANDKQLSILSKKELSQPFGLKSLSKELEKYTKIQTFDKRIMGIINANDDSFFDGSRFKGANAIAQIEKIIDDGANIVDIGAVSSRPNSDFVSKEEELNRIKPIIDEIYSSKLYERTIFSIDSYEPLVIQYALDRGFKIVNDITGLANDEVAKITAKYNATAVIMHMQGTPKDMQNNPYYDDVVFEVDKFFEERIKKAQSFGIKDIILDVGIGFGKRLEDNINLIQNLKHFQKFNKELLIGASRKSMIDMITPTKIEDRLAGTLAIHQKSLDNGSNIIRCHDVKEHVDLVKINNALNTNLV